MTRTTDRQTTRTTDPHPWRPTRRRLTDTLLTALAPVAACSIALGALSTWVAAGRAGDPARIEVIAGRVFLPYGDTRDTAAFFRITNSGDADDRLVRVSSPGVGGEVTLGRHRTTGGGAAYRDEVDSAAVPAHGSLTMSPHGLDVILHAGERWELGDPVPFTLHFRRSGPVTVEAVVVSPGDVRASP
ncbi:copper chaperone PCu(A)C [Streptomyces phaeochromogenes]|uniref:Copper chaperone PCu(A)C n=1 Tax=Streptomyces phaeochromogenes TaxID=1923 RepID=A0ABZ1H8J1_STRPH|nr:copper chaperone PCu(A)C [Streptomyces phaeochromogenes]WSD13923.1 copper chaperone PCu(A)C [Streptomyces phaeochromogenes]